jgi:hypothetical protein
MDAIIAYDSSKLPPDIHLLQDHDRPLAPDVRFFEEKYTFGDLAKQFVWGVVLMPVGALVLVVSTLMLFAADQSVYHSVSNALFVADAVGFILLAGGFLLLAALRSKFRLVRRQRSGLTTRHGVFLTPGLLIYHGDSATKVVPKPHFKGLKGRAVQFEHEGETKSFELPARLVGKDAQGLDDAVAAWGT